MIIHLLMVNGDKNEFVVLSGKDEYVIGREEGDLVLGDERASRKHAKLCVDSRGQIKLCDLKSTNGTVVNKQKISEVVLAPEDVFRVGRTIFIFFGAQAEAEGESRLAHVERNPINVSKKEEGRAKVPEKPRASPLAGGEEKPQANAARGKLGSLLLTGWPNNFRALKVDALSNFVDHLDEDQKRNSKRLIAIAQNNDESEDDAA